MKRLLLVDGHNLLFQSFYGMPRKIVNKFGNNVEAVVCFVGIIKKSIEILNSDYVCVVFDGENELARKDLLEAYKSNRRDFTDVEEADNPFSQLEYIKNCLDFFEIANLETVDCEADDFIAGVVKKYKSKFHIDIFSQDKDFYQLICDNVDVFHYRGKVSQIFDNTSFYDKFGFDAQYFDSYLSLLGDKSDNIDGIKGIGRKTATNLISKFGDIKELLKNIEKIENPRLKKSIEENKEKIVRNFKLCSLKNVEKRKISLHSFNKVRLGMKTMEVLKTLDIL